MNEPVKIDPEFRDLLPPLSDEEYSKLEELCKKQGILDSLKVWNGFIIDGHNRYQISEDWDLNYEIRDMSDEFETRSDVMQWILDNQISRRNLKKDQLVSAWSKWEQEKAKEAAEKKQSTLKQNTDSSNLNERSEPIRTAAEVAKKIGVSENTYRDMKLITNKGTPEQVERMNKGGKGNGVSRIAQEIKGKDKPPVTMKKCSLCGRILPIDEFGICSGKRDGHKGRCRSCYNSTNKTMCLPDAKGDLIRPTGEFSKVSDQEIIGDLYDTSSIVLGMDDFEDELNTNLDSAINNVQAIFNNYKTVILEHRDEARKTIDCMEKMLNTTITSLRKEYA